ncbi:hypothetical protein [Gimesia sp.]|uniref:hypothetical protein n=1 Tax=Gimesia sp. TaxID=2024833 RepID=UPI0032EFD07B
MTNIDSSYHSKLLCGLMLIIILIKSPRVQGEEIPTHEELSDIYIKKYNSIENILFEYTKVSQTSLIDEEELWQSFHVMPFIESTTTLVLNNTGNFYEAIHSRWDLVEQSVFSNAKANHPGKRIDQLAFNELQAIINHEITKVVKEPIPANILLYDGSKVWKHSEASKLTTKGKSRKVYTILNPESRSSAMLGTTLLDRLLIAFTIPDLPKDNALRLKNHLPHMLEAGTFSIAQDLEEISGHACILINSSSQSIWLDPNFGYAVRQRTWKHHDGNIVYKIEADQFEEIIPGTLWLPKVIKSQQYGIVEIANGRYAGTALHENIAEVKKIEVNQPSLDKYFSIDVPAGVWVNDTTLSPEDSDGNKLTPSDKNVTPSVSYIQPADQSDLDQVIQKARLKDASKSKESLTEPKRSKLNSIIIWFNVGFIIMILIFVFYKKYFSRA